MAAAVGDFIRNLVVIIFLNALLEMMLPQGEFRRYIRLVTGLIVILLIVGTAAALLGRAPRLVPVNAAGPAAVEESTAALPEGDSGRVGAAYSRQVLQQCRTALEEALRGEVEAGGKWEYAGAVLVLEEDSRSSSFGAPLRIDLQVRAAAGGGRVNPVSIDPVEVGTPGGAAGGVPGPPRRLAEMEQSLAELFRLAPAQVTVTVQE